MNDISPEVRQSILRDICIREGHGELVNVTTYGTLGLFSEYICQRGCGMAIYNLNKAMTLDELQERLNKLGISGKVLLRGDVEVSIG